MLFAVALFAGSAAVAGWIDVRYPTIAPPLVWRIFGAFVTLQLVGIAPVRHGSTLELYGTVFGALFPLLTLMWLHCIWLLRALHDAVGGTIG
jgi:hypothetical protein